MAVRSETAASDVEEPILSIRDTSVYFEMSRGRSVVLDDVSMDIGREEVLGVVGESGSGKSMFASALLDSVVKPGITSGEIRYRYQDGREVDILSLSDEELKRFRWEEVSMVYQGALGAFNPTMKIQEHFLETLDAHGVDRQEGMERAYRLLSDLYLEPKRVLSSYPHELSGGMLQRAFIALSLLLEPQVLVMDEPTASLDLLMQRSITSLLKEIQEEYEITLVFITHDLPLVAKLVDRLAVMYAFDFVEAGPTEDVLLDAKHPYTRALLNATPNLDAPISHMKPIEGSSPDPVNVPPGCAYHPRCPLADDDCEVSVPEHFAVDSDHHAACFHWEDIDEIPLNTQELIE